VLKEGLSGDRSHGKSNSQDHIFLSDLGGK